MKSLRTDLLDLVRERAIVHETVTLSSGKTSDVYFDGKRITLDPMASFLLARLLHDICRRFDAHAAGGPMIGADPMAGALAAVSAETDHPVSGFIVRPGQKTHGLQRQVEGPPLGEGDRVLILDDVITTGGSILQAVEAVRETGAEIVAASCLVDREQGGAEALEEIGIPLHPVFLRSEVEETERA